MNKLRLSMILLPVLAALAIACGGDSKTRISPPPGETPAQKVVDLTIGIDKDGQTVTLPMFAQLTVRLDSNHTTGYQWAVKQNTATVLAPSGDARYEGPAAGSPPGTGGADVFTFRAAGTGTVPLQLAYARSFEPNNPPAKTFSVTVTVQ